MIEFLHVDKHFGSQQVLEDVCFRINPGERVGIVGPNGAGKSTIFHLIASDISPDRGRVTIARNCKLGYLRQELDPSRIGATLLDHTADPGPVLRDLQENIHALDAQVGTPEPSSPSALRQLGELQTRFEHLGGYDVRHRAKAALSGLGFAVESFDRPFASFSGGWQMRSELARLLVADPDVMLMDEPSNYLDIPAIEWLQNFLQEFPGTLVMISHDRYLLNSLTRVTLEVANARATRYSGNYNQCAEQRNTRIEQLAARKKNLDRKRKEIERFIERFRAKNTKASQVQSRIKMLDKMEDVDIPDNIVSPGTIRLRPPPRSGEEVIRLEDAALTYDASHWILRHVDLRIVRGEIIALVGLNGTGKTTLLRMLAGHLPLSEGRRMVGHNVTIGYQSQEFAKTLDPAHTVYHTVKRVAPDVPDAQIRSLLGSFGFPGGAIEKPVDILSGGEKIRLSFARLMMQPVNFLVLDEPTTHLDITARETLEKVLKAYEGTICLVSHDIAFTRNVADVVIAMTPPGIRRYSGGYDYYHEKLAEQQAAAGSSGAAPDPSGKTDRKADRRERAKKIQEFSRLSRPLKHAMTKAEKVLEKLEKEQAGLVAALESATPDKKYAELNQRLTSLQYEISDATRRWEDAALELEQLDRQRQQALGDAD